MKPLFVDALLRRTIVSLFRFHCRSAGGSQTSVHRSRAVLFGSVRTGPGREARGTSCKTCGARPQAGRRREEATRADDPYPNSRRQHSEPVRFAVSFPARRHDGR